MSSNYSEKETESYYDAQDAIYRAFWDEDGSVHWGLFDQSTGNDFLKACANLNRAMVEKGRIDQDQKVLDLGCGNGATAIWLHHDQECHVTGIDLSGVRIDNAKKARLALKAESQALLAFEKASATDLPFPDAAFTRVWSQAVFYHVPDKHGALAEVYRVLEDGGIMVFDDLLKPQPHIGPDAKRFVYDRLLFNTDFSLESYQNALQDQGFDVLEAHDLSEHLKTSYLCLAERTPKNDGVNGDHFEELTTAYLKTAEAVDRNEIGWGLFVCQK